MARILVCEPHDEVRTLLAHVVGRLGHEVVFPEEDGGSGFRDSGIDVLVIEPADPRALAAAQILRLAQEDLPVVCASIYPASPHTRRLDPVAYLVKPFPLAALEAALFSALERVAVST